MSHIKRMYILSGIPGAGKTTLATELAQLGNRSAICSADHFFIYPDGSYRFEGAKLERAHQFCWMKIKEAAAAGCDVIVVDNANTRRNHRQEYADYARISGYQPIEILVHANVEEAVARGLHNVPLETTQRMAQELYK